MSTPIPAYDERRHTWTVFGYFVGNRYFLASRYMTGCTFAATVAAAQTAADRLFQPVSIHQGEITDGGSETWGPGITAAYPVAQSYREWLASRKAA